MSEFVKAYVISLFRLAATADNLIRLQRMMA